MSEDIVPAKSSIFKSHSIYIKIVTTFVGLLLLSTLPIIVYHYYEDKNLVADLSSQILDQVSKTVMEKAGNYFLPASLAVETGSVLARMNAISWKDHSQVELYTLGVLKNYPQISMFYFADEAGTYIRAWRLPDGSMETRLIDPGASPPRDIFRYRDAEFRIFRTEESNNNIDYNPVVRPWYVGAREKRGNFWTDLYILFRNKKPAITSSFPFIDGDGKFRGVWAMDIELDKMCDFLKNLKIGKNGIALIFNQKNEIVAYPELSRIIKEENGTARPILVEELGHPPVSEAFRQYMLSGQSKCEVDVQGQKYFASFSEFPESFPVHWKIGVVVPENDFAGGAKELILKMLGVGSIILIAAILVAIFISRSITHPIRLLAAETKKITNFDLEGKFLIVSYIKEIQLMRDAISSMKNGLQAFRRYVPAELVRQLIHTGEEARLGGHKKELTVFFSDITGFTAIAERMPAEDLMVHLSEYFDELTKIITSYVGTLDKYIGDAILAFWGAPVPDEDHAFHACCAALICREKIARLNSKWESQGKSPLPTRIGISTGETVVGNVGSSERINYTVMGDNVNLASRFESTNKLFGTQILVTGRTYEAVAEKFWFRPLGVVSVRGKIEGTPVYELVGKKTEGESGDSAELRRRFAVGMDAYLARDWEKAGEVFKALSLEFPSDGPTKFFLSRCREFK